MGVEVACPREGGKGKCVFFIVFFTFCRDQECAKRSRLRGIDRSRIESRGGVSECERGRQKVVE